MLDYRRMINSLPPAVLVQVLDALPVRIFWKDSESRYLGCNQRFADDAGIADPAELVGRSDYFFFPPEQATAFRNDDADVMFSGRAKLGIIERLTKANGQVIWLETNKLPLLNEDGAVVGIIGMYQDVTYRIEAEEERCRACFTAFVAA